MRNQKPKTVFITKRFFDPFENIEAECAWINYMKRFGRLDKRSYKEEIKKNKKGKNFGTIFYGMRGEDLKKSDPDYNLWLYMANLLLLGFESGSESYHKNDALHNFSQYGDMFLFHAAHRESSESRIGIGIQMPLPIFARFSPPVKECSNVTNTIDLYDEKGIFQHINNIISRTKEDIAI